MPTLRWIDHFGASNQHFWTFLEICSLDFSEIVLDDTLRSDQKWMFWILKKDGSYAQNGINAVFLGPNSTFFNISLNLSIEENN